MCFSGMYGIFSPLVFIIVITPIICNRHTKIARRHCLSAGGQFAVESIIRLLAVVIPIFCRRYAIELLKLADKTCRLAVSQ